MQELVNYGRSPWLNPFDRMVTLDRQRVQAGHGIDANRSVGTLSRCASSPASVSGHFFAMVLTQDTPLLLQDTLLLLLDKPTTWLDINHQIELIAPLRERQHQGRTVVAVLHNLNQASVTVTIWF